MSRAMRMTTLPRQPQSLLLPLHDDRRELGESRLVDTENGMVTILRRSKKSIRFTMSMQMST